MIALRVLALVLTITAGLPAASSLAVDPTTLEVDDRVPMAFVLSTPTGRPARVRSSELIRRIDGRVRAHTDFALVAMPAHLVTECRGRLGCLALKARPDYDPRILKRPSGGLLPYREHVRRLKIRGVAYPQYLLVVSNVTLPGRADRLSAALVDTDIALQLYHDARRDRPQWEDAFEARVDSGAKAGANATDEIQTGEEVEAFFERFLTQNVRERLIETHHWRPFGAVDLIVEVPHAAVLWDGRTVGSTARGRTRLSQARAGRRELKIQHPDYRESSQQVVVRAGETVTVQIDLQAKPRPSPLGRRMVLWSGVGLVAVGGALGVYALAREDGGATTVCVGSRCDEGRSFQTFGYAPDAAPDESINPRGVLVGPLGYSLAATGAAWSLGALLTDDEEFPWWPLIIGLAAGGVSYGLSAALNDP